MKRENVVKEFHEVMSHPVNAEWTPRLLDLRMSLVQEELLEINDEIVEIYVGLQSGDYPTVQQKARLLKEMADLQYVLSGMAVCLGLPLQNAFSRVHESNMSKLGDDGKPVLREDGKVLKGPNYLPPTLLDLIDG